MTLRFSFGTAGIRAPMGNADDQLNINTVRAIGYAIVRQLETFGDDARSRGICVGFDGRAHSRDFAVEVCRVAIAAGFLVRLFAREIPTPLLAFTTRTLDAVGGVMITASHNPASDNGIKLYLPGGAQVVAPHDRDISQRIACSCDVAEIPRVELELALQAERLLMLDPNDLEAYLAAIEQLVPSRRELPLPKIAYSATSGVGSLVARALFSRVGATQVFEVAEHALPAPDFAGLASPNPEEPEALEKLLALADRERINIAFAHDPDADRLAVVARMRDGSLRALSGDEVGALIGDFLLAERPDPSSQVLVSTHVSGGLLEEVCRARGAHFVRTPTGFKWIAALGRAYAREQHRELLFGYEEAIGYAFFGMAEDKDGTAAMYVLLELVRRLHAEGKTLAHRLEELALAHGYFATRPMSIALPASSRVEENARILSLLRSAAPSALLGGEGTLVDFDASATPASLLVWQALDGSRVCARPSGTEPKLKLYLHVREAVNSAQDLSQAKLRATRRLDDLERRARALVGS